MNEVISTFNYIWKDLNSIDLEPCKRATQIALPFLYLHAPIAAAGSLSLGIYTIYHLSKEFDPNSPWQKNSWVAAKCAASAFHLGITYASPLGGALLSSGTLLGKQVYHLGDHLSKKDFAKFRNELLETMVTIVHLSAIFSGLPALISLSIVFRSLSTLKESYSSYRAGEWPEALASLVLAIIQLSSARPYISETWRQYFRKNLSQQDLDEFFRDLSQRRKNSAEITPHQPLPDRDCSPALATDSPVVQADLRPIISEIIIEDICFDLSSQHLEWLDFSDLIFKNCSFSRATMENSTFQYVEFINCRFDSLSFKDCKLKGTSFRHCKLDTIQFEAISFDEECKFKSSLIKNSWFLSSEFKTNRFISSKIRGSSFANCLFKDTAFFDNDIERVAFEQSTVQDTSFNDSRLKEVQWLSSEFRESTFLGVQAENSAIKSSNLIDTVFCEAESALVSGNSNFRENKKPVVSITWNFLEEGIYTPLACEKLKKNGMVPLKFQAFPIGIDPLLVEKEVYTALANLEHVQIASAHCLGEKLLLCADPGSQLDKIYKQAALIAKFSQAHLLPGGNNIEAQLYGKKQVPLWYLNKDLERVIGKVSEVRNRNLVIPHNQNVTKHFSISMPGWGEARCKSTICIHSSGFSRSFHSSEGSKELLRKIRYLIFHAEDIEVYTKSLLELSILSHANHRKQKVLGICRGAQMINVFYNGTIRFVGGEGEEGIQAFRSLPLASSKAEQLKKELFGVDNIHGFSMHYQCADKIGDGLHVLYESETGVPKMIVHENGRVIGSQCHPEMYDDSDTIEDPNFLKSAPLFRGLFQRLASAN